MNSIESLIDALALCVPQLDPVPLREDPPNSSATEDILLWISDHLQQQELLVYEEWKEYFGHVPDLKPLSGIDLSRYDGDLIPAWAESIDWDEISPEIVYSMPYAAPYLEYLNGFLREHGIRLVDLAPIENAYIIAVKDDVLLLERLASCLQPFELGINLRQALDGQETLAYLNRLLCDGC